MIFLDTTILIDFLNGVTEAVDKVISLGGTPVFTSRLNIFEVLVGLFSIKRSEKFIQDHFMKFAALSNRIQILELDSRSTLKAAEIAGVLNKRGTPIDSIDCIAAGIAISNGINTMLTRNKKHFENIDGIKVEAY